MNEVMNVFNYGQNDYQFVTHITDESCGDGFQQRRRFRKEKAQYQIHINNYRELCEMMEEYAEKFPRFVKKFMHTIESLRYNAYIYKNNNDEVNVNIRGHSFVINGYIISKAFLSYIIQNKNNILEIFNYTIHKKYKMFLIKNIQNIFKIKKRRDGYNIWADGKYKDVQVYNNEKSCEEKYDIQIINSFAYINKERYNIYSLKYTKDGWLLMGRWSKYNDYNEFKNLLSKYFQSVNVHNDNNFDKYLDDEVQQLMRMNFDQELKQLQS